MFVPGSRREISRRRGRAPPSLAFDSRSAVDETRKAEARSGKAHDFCGRCQSLLQTIIGRSWATTRTSMRRRALVAQAGQRQTPKPESGRTSARAQEVLEA